MSDNENRVDRAFESSAGRAWSHIVNILFGIVATALLSIIVINTNHSNAIAEQQQDRNSKQDTNIAVLSNRLDYEEAKTQAVVANLTALTKQVQAMTEAINDHETGQRPRR